MTTFVGVHGGGHGGWCYGGLASWLQASGHLVHAPSLSGRGEHTHRAHGRWWDVDTAHDLMITDPDPVSEILFEIAADMP